MKRLLALLIVAALISLGTVAYAAGWKENQKETLTVENWKGKHVGIVKYVVMNPSTRKVTFVILYLNKEGKKEIAVPPAAFSSYDWENRILILNVSEEELVSAPEFHDSDLDNPAFTEGVYKFFGLMPAWTDEKKEERKRM